VSAARQLVIALHGYEDEPADLADLLAPLDSELRPLVALRGPIDAPHGPAWFTSDDAGPVEAELRRSLDVLDLLIDRTAADHGLDRSAVVLGGFSQGGVAALAYALFGAGAAAPLAGLFCVSGFLVHAESVPYDIAGLAAGGTPVLVVHGAEDDVVAVQQGRSVARLLERKGVAVRYVEVDGDHHLGPRAVDALAAWLSDLDA
jgi:phospholipase/carboxylesterase